MAGHHLSPAIHTAQSAPSHLLHIADRGIPPLWDGKPEVLNQHTNCFVWAVAHNRCGLNSTPLLPSVLELLLPAGIVDIEVEFDPQCFKDVLKAGTETRTPGRKMKIRKESAAFEIRVYLRRFLSIKLGRKSQ